MYVPIFIGYYYRKKYIPMNNRHINLLKDLPQNFRYDADYSTHEKKLHWFNAVFLFWKQRKATKSIWYIHLNKLMDHNLCLMQFPFYLFVQLIDVIIVFFVLFLINLQYQLVTKKFDEKKYNNHAFVIHFTLTRCLGSG